jgi:hypothetical protein
MSIKMSQKFQTLIVKNSQGNSLYCGKLPQYKKYSIHLTVLFYGTLQTFAILALFKSP